MPQFLILANDFKDGQALERRLSVREQHLQRMREEKLKGKFVIGGAKLDEDGRMKGSMLVVDLESEDAVKQWVSEDPYVIGKVWDQIDILPFRVAPV